MTRPTIFNATQPLARRSGLHIRTPLRDRPQCQAERILSKAVEDGAPQFIVAPVDLDVLRLLGLRKAVALLTKPRGVPAITSKAGNAEPQRSTRGENPLVVIFV